jgi:hypothetical protein
MNNVFRDFFNKLSPIRFREPLTETLEPEFLILGKVRAGIEIQSNYLRKRGCHETNGSID